jgi:hypothetical protein
MKLIDIPPKTRIAAVVRLNQAFQVRRQFIVISRVRDGARKVPYIACVCFFLTTLWSLGGQVVGELELGPSEDSARASRTQAVIRCNQPGGKLWNGLGGKR